MKAKNWTKLKQRMSPEARARVDARVAKTIAALPLPEMRKAIGLTQQDLAARLVTGQGSVSKLEHAADMYLSTLRKYVEALGGELHLVTSFPEGRKFEIGCLADK